MAHEKSVLAAQAMPVLIGVVPLFAVTSLVINEGYKTAAIAGSSVVQMLTPTTKTISIEALLIGGWRSLRATLEEMALTSRALAGVTGPAMQFSGIPVVTKSGVSLDMQITSLSFTQDNQMRDTLRVSMTLTHVPRSQAGSLVGTFLNLELAVGSAFI
jgi:hypothetical protein